MPSVSIDSLLDQVEKLSVEDQIIFTEVLHKRLLEEKRKRFVQTVHDGLAEYKAGKTDSGSVDDLLKKIDE